jgi:predicted PurR-regulated permease PerM
MQQPSFNTFRIPAVLLSICLTGFVLYVGQDIIIPVVLAAFFAILLSPIVVFLESKKVPRLLSIAIAVILAIAVITGLVYFISLQLSSFFTSLPELEKKLEVLLVDSLSNMANSLHLKTDNVQYWLTDTKKDLISDSRKYIGTTLTTLSGILAILILLPVYTIMILYYEPLFMSFVQQVVPQQKHEMTRNIIMEAKTVMQSYLTGLMLEVLIVATLNTTGLLLLGIDYAILWAIIGAILNIIPYIGITISTIFPFMMALITKDPAHGFLVLAVYAVVQFIDNNIIVPKVVASRIRINALTTVIVVVIGGTLWGVAGMFLALPLVAVVKIICDRIPHLKPYGFLIGDSMPTKPSFLTRIRPGSSKKNT